MPKRYFTKKAHGIVPNTHLLLRMRGHTLPIYIAISTIYMDQDGFCRLSKYQIAVVTGYSLEQTEEAIRDLIYWNLVEEEEEGYSVNIILNEEEIGGNNA